MNKKTYIKPTIQEVTIQMNDLCAGSMCNTIDVKVIGIRDHRDHHYRFSEGETIKEGMWNPKF